MQAAQLTLVNPTISDVKNSNSNTSDWITRLFGCWHREMSRPFSHQGKAYRSCLHCGAKRQFNLGKWETHGNYYYNVETRTQFYQTNLAPVRKAVN